jgi:hypothetical protein
VLYNHSKKAELLPDFYVNLLGTSTPPVWGFDLHAAMRGVAGLQDLDKPFTLQDAREAVWASPGPDGFGPACFRTFWDISTQTLWPSSTISTTEWPPLMASIELLLL